MSKHTPGPWKFTVADLVKSEHGITYHEVYGSNNSVVARRVISDSDAALIAAAPELLKVAKAALIALDAANEVLGGWESKEGYYSRERAQLKKVIAKAEGKESK